MGEPVKSIVPAENVKDYSGIIYWNSFEVILEHWNMSITGSATETWYEYVRDRFGPFDRALFVNCGNGWVERALFQSGTIRSAVGFDINGELLSQAREEALQLGMPSHYVVADCNIFDATTLGKFDLIVNYAAMHRVVYLNRITQQIAEMLN